MPHFAARARGELAVEMDLRAGDVHRSGQPFRAGGTRARAKQIYHYGGRSDKLGCAQRQAEHRAQMILELRRDAAFDAVVAGIVWPGRELVVEHRVACREELDAGDAETAGRPDGTPRTR